ncbi:uncharacterized protein ColSpa_04413 [Colletotrichum spaethianum]|uniref:Uncharacterized protein n=1 Tax=Colletotrichum spaethianum TaxID=700344 RepID=A0AA37LHK0_9PEZI|nr:uncharacterized protein ColSpa_04413 [Colletotrichum spaethianum]GKT44232.1 hypothetical protein ColSpa_04413 [Colletotrichum spaethianum]
MHFSVAQLLVALLTTTPVKQMTATAAVGVDQNQFAIPCVMDYVGCVAIPNFNDVFSRLIGNSNMEPRQCQRFCAGLNATQFTGELRWRKWQAQPVQGGCYYCVHDSLYDNDFFDDLFASLPDYLNFADLVSFISSPWNASYISASSSRAIQIHRLRRP